MLRAQGFTWVSSRYPAHLYGEPGQPPTKQVQDSLLSAQSLAQPFAYDDGLIEIPMSPISDIGAFRNGRWKLEHFLAATRAGVQWAIDRGGVFDFLAHPACLYVTDPKFETLDLICALVEKAGDRAELVDLTAIAGRLH
jgi:hypothetical protein